METLANKYQPKPIETTSAEALFKSSYNIPSSSDGSVSARESESATLTYRALDNVFSNYKIDETGLLWLTSRKTDETFPYFGLQGLGQMHRNNYSGIMPHKAGRSFVHRDFWAGEATKPAQKPATAATADNYLTECFESVTPQELTRIYNLMLLATEDKTPAELLDMIKLVMNVLLDQVKYEHYLKMKISEEGISKLAEAGMVFDSRSCFLDSDNCRTYTGYYNLKDKDAVVPVFRELCKIVGVARPRYSEELDDMGEQTRIGSFVTFHLVSDLEAKSETK